MTDRESYFAKLYSEQRAKIASLTIDELAVLLSELEEIATEAKINVRATDDEFRERKAKLSKEQREKLINPNISDSDAINIPERRKDRLTKKEKLAALLGDLMGEADAKAILGTVKVNTVSDNGTNPPAPKPNEPLKVTKIVNAEPTDSPFDPSSLFGK